MGENIVAVGKTTMATYRASRLTRLGSLSDSTIVCSKPVTVRIWPKSSGNVRGVFRKEGSEQRQALWLTLTGVCVL